jgi:hypothetical protein
LATSRCPRSRRPVPRVVRHLWLLASLPATLAAQEVRQIVTFLFQPGQGAEAQRIYAERLRPLYEGNPAMRRVRGYREIESPVPLDLIIVSSFAGMAGMEASNEHLRRAPAGERSAFEWYGTLAGMTQHHHDQLVEMMPALSDSASPDAGQLTVFEYYRVAPGLHGRFELQLQDQRRRERRDRLYAWSETGRLLVSDGWDYLRIFGLASLADWERYRLATRQGPADALVAARRTIIVRGVPAIAVR